jgi:DNA-binding response OmpR family regulator
MSDPSRRAKTAATEHLYHRRPARQPKVLIVEDHDDTREMLRTLLTMWGCRVLEACNGLEAVESAEREQPVLILMDLSLPFLDGVQASRRIRQSGLTGIRIVALNGWGTRSYSVAALAAGCDDCLVKPMDFDSLRAYLGPLLESPSTIKGEDDLSLH